ncbi:GNAT family N-acetyltransferase [Ornithinibacillus halophilus]|uniref:L-amino acid N-acyltransferase YncA n=1 Tax=Ornithinibacillus halophilus TaxID=930117 RepID=A0A1M5HYK7_9BACI|nr:GNAT family N-acetyltransferase [Ornithinibacillus halophilus]SHG21075.1 L-amino acid N-acyltransferase YncA [Ornithinibacillus halophilus]
MYSIREANFEDAASIANVHVSSWKSTYQELLEEKDLSNMTYENRKTLWETILKIQKDNQRTYVMERTHDNKIVGFISGGPERTKRFDFDAEIYNIYLLDEFQKKGLGAQLLHKFTLEMKNLGFESILVWVLTRNPSSRFYERYQAKPIGTEDTTIGKGTYQETAYGWKQLDKLLELL